MYRCSMLIHVMPDDDTVRNENFIHHWLYHFTSLIKISEYFIRWSFSCSLHFNGFPPFPGATLSDARKHVEKYNGKSKSKCVQSAVTEWCNWIKLKAKLTITSFSRSRITNKNRSNEANDYYYYTTIQCVAKHEEGRRDASIRTNADIFICKTVFVLGLYVVCIFVLVFLFYFIAYTYYAYYYQCCCCWRLSAAHSFNSFVFRFKWFMCVYVFLYLILFSPLFDFKTVV